MELNDYTVEQLEEARDKILIANYKKEASEKIIYFNVGGDGAVKTILREEGGGIYWVMNGAWSLKEKPDKTLCFGYGDDDDTVEGRIHRVKVRDLSDTQRGYYEHYFQPPDSDKSILSLINLLDSEDDIAF